MNRALLRFYLQFFEGAVPTLGTGVLVSIGQSLTLVPVALLVRRAFDETIPAGDVSRLTMMGLGIVALYLVSSGLGLWSRLLVLQKTKIAVKRLRLDLLAKLYTLPRSYYSRAEPGRLQTVVVQDTERLDRMTNALFGVVAPAAIITVALCSLLVFLNWFLFLAIVLFIPLLYVVQKMLWLKEQAYVKRFHRAFEAFNNGILFVLEKMDLTRIRAAESYEKDRRGKTIDDLHRTSVTMVKLHATYKYVQDAALLVASIIVLVLGGNAVASGGMTVGELLSFYVVIGLVRIQMSGFMGAMPDLFEGRESLSSLYDFANLDTIRPYRGVRRIPFKGNISLQAVRFQYVDRPILADACLTVRRGERVALVGSNGAGKSTVTALILGFYRPQKGGLTADGIDYDGLDLNHLRRQIGVVTQSPLIFNGTILENITYGRPETAMEAVVEAAKIATAHSFIEALPQGYQTPVGDRGVLLSGGERQRVVLTRALLNQPPLLILDEPTNHLDWLSISRLLDNIRHIDPAPGILVVSHNFDTLQNADRAYYLRPDGTVMSGLPDEIRRQALSLG
jgi:ABC-type bacteriocin/lantibiotic exporter with double-glycine peptidase domain